MNPCSIANSKRCDFGGQSHHFRMDKNAQWIQRDTFFIFIFFSILSIIVWSKPEDSSDSCSNYVGVSLSFAVEETLPDMLMKSI